MTLSPRLAPFAALAFGGLLPLSLAPFNFWPAGMVACAGLFWLWERLPQRTTSIGWWFGVGKYAVGASWIYVSIHVYGNASVPLALALVALFVTGMALFVLTQGWFYGRLRPHTSGLGVPLLFVLHWVLWEWFLTWVLTGFPWLFLGYGHLTTPLGNFAPLGGVLLVSLAVALSACCLAYVAQQRALGWAGLARSATVRGALLLALAPWLMGALVGYGNWVTLGPEHSVALLQNNVAQDQKWLPDQRVRMVQAQEQLTESHWGSNLVVWPEAAVTFYEHQAQPLLENWQRRGARLGTTLVLGIPHLKATPQGEGTAGLVFYNAALAVGNGSGRYLKHQLVPFGEYVPLAGLLRGLIDFFDLPMSNSGNGAAVQPLLAIGDHFAAMSICYEIAYPALVAQQVRGNGLSGTAPPHQSADVILTISNDAWFGTSLGPDQHLQIAQMRAKENGRYVLRSTQTGWTAIIDEQGQIQARLPRFTAAVLSGQYRPAQGLTPFSRWGHAPLCGLLVLLLVVVVSLRASNANSHSPKTANHDQHI